MKETQIDKLNTLFDTDNITDASDVEEFTNVEYEVIINTLEEVKSDGVYKISERLELSLTYGKAKVVNFNHKKNE